MSTKINVKGENTFEQSPIITGHNNTVIIQGTESGQIYSMQRYVKEKCSIY